MVGVRVQIKVYDETGRRVFAESATLPDVTADQAIGEAVSYIRDLRQTWGADGVFDA